MKIITVFDSYLNESRIAEYFSSLETKLHLVDMPAWQKDSFLGKIALKHTYKDSNFSQITINYSNSGQPILIEAPNLHCSIAHSYGLAVAVSAPFKIGVDVEKIRYYDESLLKFIASKHEIELFKEDHLNVAVTKIWVIKETVSKALGIGIAYPFKDMLIKKDKNNYSIKVRGIKWSIRIFPYNDYIIGFCCPSDENGRFNLGIKYLQ